jgi:hypothetical protein
MCRGWSLAQKLVFGEDEQTKEEKKRCGPKGESWENSQCIVTQFPVPGPFVAWYSPPMIPGNLRGFLFIANNPRLGE